MDTDWPLIGARFALYVLLSSLFGLSAFSLYALPAEGRKDVLPLGPWLACLAAGGLLFSAVALAIMAAAMAGTAPWPIDRDAIRLLLEGTPTGTAWWTRVAALAVAGLAGGLARGRSRWLGLAALASAVALANLAWTGHGAMDEGAAGWQHLAADIVHLLAAGAWIGALLGLILLVMRGAQRVNVAHLRLSHRALHGFGTVGTILVGTIVLTGLINAWFLIGPAKVPTLAVHTYGQLLIAKLGLFAVMLGIASLNRFRLTPDLERSIEVEDHQAALGLLRRSLAVETGCALAILGLVAWLGVLEPLASM
jgi:putative copper resistance protein D